jgi:hypothetical protein
MTATRPATEVQRDPEHNESKQDEGEVRKFHIGDSY